MRDEKHDALNEKKMRSRDLMVPVVYIYAVKKQDGEAGKSAKGIYISHPRLWRASGACRCRLGAKMQIFRFDGHVNKNLPQTSATDA